MTSSPFQHITLAWDGSPDAAAALDLAIRLVGHDGGSITAVAILDPGPHSETREESALARTAELEVVERSFEPIRQRALEAHIRLSLVTIDSSDAVQALLEHATRHGSDLIAIGRRGSTGHLHHSLGPVARELAAKSPLPVLITGET